MAFFPQSSLDSYYTASATPTAAHPTLDGDVVCDVCVVGGGITGCSTALHLAQKGFQVVVIDRERVGFGASGRSGGQVIGGFNRDLATLTRLVGDEGALALLRLSVDAVDLTAGLIHRHGIACDFVRGHITAGVKPSHRKDLATAAADWHKIGQQGIALLDQQTTRQRTGSPLYTCGLYDPAGGHLHPLNYTLGLMQAAERQGVRFYQQTPLVRWQERSVGESPILVTTPTGTLRCSFLVLAGNAYLWQDQPALGKTIMPVGTYLIATEPLSPDHAAELIPHNEAVADLFSVLNYYRLSADRRLLFGGGVSYSRFDPRSIADSLGATMRHVLPTTKNLRVDYGWGGYVAITRNRLPQIGVVSPHVVYAQGYSGHGIALAGLAGRVLSEAIAGQPEHFAQFLSIPHHAFPGGAWARTPLLVLAMAWHRLKDRWF